MAFELGTAASNFGNFASGLGSVLGGIGSFFGSGVSAKTQQNFNKELMSIQNKYNVNQYKHRHQWEMQDLRAAGLNPILTATGGSAGSVSGVGLPSAPDVASIGEKRANTAMAISRFGKELQQLSANIKSTNADAYLKDAMIGTEISKQENLSADSALKTLQQTEQSIRNSFLPKQLKADLLKTNAETQNQLAQAQAASAMSFIGYERLEIDREHYRNADFKTKKEREWAEKHPLAFSLDQGIQKHAGSAGAAVGAGVGSALGIGKISKLKGYRQGINDYSKYYSK